MNKKLSSIILIILIILGMLFFVVLFMPAYYSIEPMTEVVFSTNPEQRISIFESNLTRLLKSDKTITFRVGDVGFIQFSTSKDKHLVMMIPLAVSIPYTKSDTWAKFFIKTQYHKITLSTEQVSRLREIPELRDAPVKVTSKKKTRPEHFIEADLGTDVKRASEITEDVFIKVFQAEPNHQQVISTFADFRKIQWGGHY